MYNPYIEEPILYPTRLDKPLFNTYCTHIDVNPIQMYTQDILQTIKLSTKHYCNHTNKNKMKLKGCSELP